MATIREIIESYGTERPQNNLRLFRGFMGYAGEMTEREISEDYDEYIDKFLEFLDAPVDSDGVAMGGCVIGAVYLDDGAPAIAARNWGDRKEDFLAVEFPGFEDQIIKEIAPKMSNK